jgi:hypothetical protein
LLFLEQLRAVTSKVSEPRETTKQRKVTSKRRGSTVHTAGLVLLGLLLVALAFTAGGCGGSDSKTSAEALLEKSEELKSESLLVRAEIIQARLAESSSGAASEFRVAKKSAIQGAVRVEHACHFGNGLEECGKLRDIEKIVQEIREAQP